MTIDLDSFPIMERTRWWMLLIGVTAPFAKLCELLSITNHSGMIPIVTIITLMILATIAGLTKRCSLDGTSRSITILTSFFGLQIHKKTLSTDRAVWVRARLAGTYQTAIIIEIGTRGYETTRLFKMSYKSGKNLPHAEDICSQVAHLLGIENKGYKGLA